jgi:hypothetical protein
MEDPADFGSIMKKILGLTPQNNEVLSCYGISKLEDLPGYPLPSKKLISGGLAKDDVAKLETFRQWYRSVPPYAKANVLDHCDDDVLKAFALSRDEKSQSFLKLIGVVVFLVFLVICSSVVARVYIGSIKTCE